MEILSNQHFLLLLCHINKWLTTCYQTGAVETDISICKNEQQISKDATHNVTVNGTEIALQIEPVSKDDEGCYQIKVKGHESKVQGQVNVQVNVKEEPEIV